MIKSEKLAYILRAIVAVVFLTAAGAKALGLDEFRRVTSAMTVLPFEVRQVLPLVIPVIEATVAIILVCGSFVRLSSWVALSLLIAFSIVLGWQLLHPFMPSCKCFGALSLAQDVHTEAIIGLIRNGAMIACLSGALWLTPRRLFPPSSREFGTADSPTHQVSLGFTLVEMLAVIGIIGLLVALLLPAIGRVRAQARQVQCAAQLRDIHGGLVLFAQQHRGTMPVVGRIDFPTPPVPLAEVLGDSDRSRQAYWSETTQGVALVPGGFQLVPLPLAWLGVIDRAAGGEAGELLTRDEWDAYVSRHELLRTWYCPAVEAERRTMGIPHEYGTQQAGYAALWYTSVDYAANAYVLGIDRPDSKLGRCGGRLEKVRNASQTVLLAEAALVFKNRTNKTLMPVWDLPPGSSLADMLDPVVAPAGPLVGGSRHGKALNVLYVDGHVASEPATPAGLAHSILTP